MELTMSEIRSLLETHLNTIFDGDIDAYKASTVPELTLYEWHVTPHRIEGIPFHEFVMAEAKRDDTAGIALDPHPELAEDVEKARVRFDLANYKEQVYENTAICSYTMLISKGSSAGVRVSSYNESRVLVRIDKAWKVVHVHKSPSWNAPFQPR
jgi:hypothetical protein